MQLNLKMCGIIIYIGDDRMIKKRLLISFLLLSIVSITGCSNNIKNQSNDRNENASQIEIINEYINIRKEKSIDSDVIGKVYKGEIYTVISSDDSANKWIEIETTNKIHGYISGIDNYVKHLESLEEKNNKYKTKYQKYEWKCDVSMKEIKTIKDNGMMDIQPKLFITKNGDLYQFSLEKKFSNEQNCKKYETEIKFDHFFIYPNDRDLSVIVGNNNKYYSTNDNKELVEFCAEHCAYAYKKSVSDMDKKYPNSYGKWIFNSSNGDFFDRLFYLKDNKIYTYDYQVGDTFKVLGEKEYSSLPDDELFVSIEGRIIKTSKAFYKIGIINQQQCSQYEDVDCVEGLLKLDEISNHYNDIDYFNGNYIIFKNDNNIYIYSSY